MLKKKLENCLKIQLFERIVFGAPVKSFMNLSVGTKSADISQHQTTS